jgi:hypothetical protein
MNSLTFGCSCRRADVREPVVFGRRADEFRGFLVVGQMKLNRGYSCRMSDKP